MIKKGPGKPKIKLDYGLIEKLAHIQCIQSEIADALDVSLSTLKRDKEFHRIYKKGIQSGKISLRRLQWKFAEKGSIKMLIWLGKQYLGQIDKQEFSGMEPIELKIIHVRNKKEIKQKQGIEIGSKRNRSNKDL